VLQLLYKSILGFRPLYPATVVRRVVFLAATCEDRGAYPQLGCVCPKRRQRLHCSGRFGSTYDCADTHKPHRTWRLAQSLPTSIQPARGQAQSQRIGGSGESIEAANRRPARDPGSATLTAFSLVKGELPADGSWQLGPPREARRRKPYWLGAPPLLAKWVAQAYSNGFAPARARCLVRQATRRRSRCTFRLPAH
jgi:hypothetical protein